MNNPYCADSKSVSVRPRILVPGDVVSYSSSPRNTNCDVFITMDIDVSRGILRLLPLYSEGSPQGVLRPVLVDISSSIDGTWHIHPDSTTKVFV